MNIYAFGEFWRCLRNAVAGVAAILLSMLIAHPGGATACAGSKIAESAGSAMIKAAQAGSASGFSGALNKYADMNAIALFALGKHRKELPAARRAEFVSLTTSFVSRRFNDYRLKFRADRIVPMTCNGNTVRTQLIFLGNKGPQVVLWRMSGGKIADVNVQGVWLGQLLRTNFDKVLSGNPDGITALFAHLKG